MLTMDHEAGLTRHFPSDPTKFEFNTEVAAIFDDMADRSIPLFRESHRNNAVLARSWVLDGGDILDIGASRGAFLRALDAEYGIENLSVKATDISDAMVGYMANDFPSVNVSQVDITSQAFLSCLSTYDVINMTYVLQFIPKQLQRLVLGKVCGMVRKGGVLFIGQKNLDESPAGRALHERYILWRMENGYTRDEIEAKTAALKNSMWPAPEDLLIQDLKGFGMAEVVRTSSWGPFSNLMCFKR